MLRRKLIDLQKSKIALFIGFCVFNNTTQLVPNAAYTKLNYNSVIYDEGNRYDSSNSSWTPVLPGEIPKIVKFSGQAYIIGGAGTNNNNPKFVVKVYKTNHTGIYWVFTGIGTPDMTLPGIVSIQFNGQDLAQPGDSYTVYLNASASMNGNIKFKSPKPGTVLIDSSRYHNFWCGSD